MVDFMAILWRFIVSSYTSEQHSETSNSTTVGVSVPPGHRMGNCVVCHDFELRATHRDSDNGPFGHYFRVPLGTLKLEVATVPVGQHHDERARQEFNNSLHLYAQELFKIIRRCLFVST
jgi:hypothetical protein